MSYWETEEIFLLENILIYEGGNMNLKTTPLLYFKVS
ncbi:MAG: hypothetical protein ACJAW3_001607 [Lentimonas sp.]|jgi:hypothetical protein